MFGGAGLYHDGQIFGLFSGGTIFLKTDAQTRPAFVEAASRPFSFIKGGKQVETSYWSCPTDALEDGDALKDWVELACAAASRAGKRPARL
jgi:DNA transformation protein